MKRYTVIISNNRTGSSTRIRTFLVVDEAYEFISELYDTITGEKGYYEVEESFGFEIGDSVIYVKWE